MGLLPETPALLTFLGASVVLLLVSAKTHGRQIRLERELEGHFEIDFRRENHPWVEALWRRDRIQYWTTAGFTTLGLLGTLWLLRTADRLPLGVGAAGPRFWILLSATLVLGSMSVAFLANGFTSFLRLGRALAAPADGGRRLEVVRRERGAWYAAVRRGNRLWWTSSALALVLVVGTWLWA